MWSKKVTIRELQEEIKRLRAVDLVTALEHERAALEATVKDLKIDLGDLRLKRKIEDEDIKHLVKMKQESLELDHKKRLMDVETEKATAIAKVKDAYQDKAEKQLITERDGIRKMYSEILQQWGPAQRSHSSHKIVPLSPKPRQPGLRVQGYNHIQQLSR